MGVLMESSQVNIHARNEPKNHGDASESFYIVEKCGETNPARVPPPSGESEMTDYFRLPIWEGSKLELGWMRYGEHGSESSKRPRSPGSSNSMPPPKKKWMKNYMGKHRFESIYASSRGARTPGLIFRSRLHATSSHATFFQLIVRFE
jgi:hypothetical protein